MRSTAIQLPLLAVAVLVATGCDEKILIQAPPVMEVGIERIEFGSIPVGKSASRTLVIQNAGSSELRLVPPDIQDNTDQAFGVTAYDAVIFPASDGTMTVTFSPRDIRRYESVLRVRGNDPDNPEALVTLGGDGYRRGAIEVEPTRCDFGKVNAGQASLCDVLVRSVGNGDLEILGIDLTAETHPDFSILSSTQPGPLKTGTEALVRLAYRPGPSSLPPDPGRMIVSSDDPFHPEITVTLVAGLNQAPLADAGPDQDVDPLTPVTLDGSASSDPDGDLPLAYGWTLKRWPEGSTTILTEPDTAQPDLIPDLVGVYEAELLVTDSTGLQSLLPDRVVVTAVPAERLLIELVWDSPVADLDLHMLAPGGLFGSALDCYYGNPTPDWGEPGGADDPRLKRDDLAGFGPETVGYDEPPGGTYRFIIDYFAAHTPSGQEPTTATLRVFVDGILEAEMVRRLEEQGQRWTAGSVLWPEGTVSEVDVLE